MKNKIQFTILPKPIGRGMLSILIKAVQHGRSVNIDTSVNIFKDEWNDTDGVVVNNPNSKSLNKYIRQTIYDLETIEFDAPFVGVYYVYSPTTGFAVLFPLGTQPLTGSPFLFSHASANVYSVDLETEGKIGVNRKQNNGNLFVKNNTSSSKNIRVYLISNF